MARDFDGTTQHLQAGSAPVTAVPLSMSCMAYYDGAGANDHNVCQIADDSASDQRFELGLASSDQLEFRTTAGVQVGAAVSTADIPFNEWFHGGGVSATTTSRFCYLNGVEGAENTNSVTPTGLDVFDIGWEGTVSNRDWWFGMLAELAVWNVALTAGEMLTLSKGYSPLFVRPASLVFYAPMVGKHSPEVDVIGGSTLTPTNAPLQVPHPGMIYPDDHNIFAPATVVAGGATPHNPFGHPFYGPFGGPI